MLFSLSGINEWFWKHNLDVKIHEQFSNILHTKKDCQGKGLFITTYRKGFQPQLTDREGVSSVEVVKYKGSKLHFSTFLQSFYVKVAGTVK
jgi:hypothetical protein